MTTPPCPPRSRVPTPAEAADRGFWRQLCPELTISDCAAIPPVRAFDPRSLLGDLRTEGYVNVPDVFGPDDIKLRCEGVRSLAACGILPAFAFIYDEYWSAFHALEAFLSTVLGERYRMLPDVWAWYVYPTDDAAGWVPHRDRPAGTLREDNSPNALTVWLPLSDATPLNGCMYVLPARHDPDLHAPQASEIGDSAFTGDRLQDIRALPAPAGSLLAWNQALLHWGGRASHLGTAPRCSIAAQFQRGDLPAFEAPLLDPQALPAFHDRLGLIGRLICGFSGFLSLPPELRLLATALRWKYGPGQRGA